MRQRIVMKATHSIHLDRPDVIVEVLKPFCDTQSSHPIKNDEGV
ncbi:hypothetical protein [Brevibacillus reuszeri]|nr:hypothetical protein [Brevibacillus reuszeri]MED1860969.1 hypothetical protein [Brevibacillus reuszeri]